MHQSPYQLMALVVLGERSGGSQKDCRTDQNLEELIDRACQPVDGSPVDRTGGGEECDVRIFIFSSIVLFVRL